MKELASTLRKLRGNRSLRDISEISGISHSYIKLLEDNSNPLRGGMPPEPTPSTLRKLATAYNHPYGDLMKAAGYLDGISLPLHHVIASGTKEIDDLKSQNAALKNCLKSLLDSM